MSDESWLQDIHNALRQELDDLYDAMEEDNMDARQRVALILRAFDHMETGQYGVCTCCAVRISKKRLEVDPVRDTCDTCG